MGVPIEPIHIQRFNAKAWSLNDPCFICGGTFKLDGSGCGHDGTDTDAFIRRVKELGAVTRKAMLNK